MRGKVLAAVMVGLLIGADKPRQHDFGKMEYQFPVPSKWILVRGNAGTEEVAKAVVDFNNDGTVTFTWRLKGRDGALRESGVPFHIHKLTKLPVIPGLGILEPRLVRSQLVLRSPMADEGTMELILKESTSQTESGWDD